MAPSNLFTDSTPILEILRLGNQNVDASPPGQCVVGCVSVFEPDDYLATTEMKDRRNEIAYSGGY